MSCHTHLSEKLPSLMRHAACSCGRRRTYQFQMVREVSKRGTPSVVFTFTLTTANEFLFYCSHHFPLRPKRLGQGYLAVLYIYSLHTPCGVCQLLLLNRSVATITRSQKVYKTSGSYPFLLSRRHRTPTDCETKEFRNPDLPLDRRMLSL